MMYPSLIKFCSGQVNHTDHFLFQQYCYFPLQVNNKRMAGMTVASLKHHIALQPLFVIMGVGLVFVGAYCFRYRKTKVQIFQQTFSLLAFLPIGISFPDCLQREGGGAFCKVGFFKLNQTIIFW